MANLSAKTGFTPVQTRVTLANNATTSVQEFAAYDGQELTGFVFIDATIDYRATVNIQVVKNGAGTYEVAAADIAGDDNGGSPIVSFSMSGSVLRATLVSYAGFVSAYIQYNLNAPALGANFPLTVDSSNVAFATIKASTGSGITFQEDGGTAAGSFADNGVWTLGTSSASFAGNNIQGKKDGVAVAAGLVGEMFGTLRSGTGGFTYSTRSTTTPTTSYTALISLTLNKGVYLIYGNLGCALSVAGQLFGYLTIGTTQVTSPVSQGSPNTGGYNMTVAIAAPINISADTTVVSIYGNVSSVTGLVVNGHELFAVRIA